MQGRRFIAPKANHQPLGDSGTHLVLTAVGEEATARKTSSAVSLEPADFVKTTSAEENLYKDWPVASS